MFLKYYHDTQNATTMDVLFLKLVQGYCISFERNHSNLVCKIL